MSEVDAPTPFDKPKSILDRLLFPSMCVAYLLGRGDIAATVDALTAERDALRTHLDEWEAEGAPAWVDAKRQEIRDARARAWDEGAYADATSWLRREPTGPNPYRGDNR